MFDLSKAKVVTDSDSSQVEEMNEPVVSNEREPEVNNDPVVNNEPVISNEPVQESVVTSETVKDDFPVDRFKGKFNNWDEVESFLSKEPENPFKDEFIKQVVDKYNSDGSLKDYFEAHATDWTKTSDEEVLRKDFFDTNADLGEDTLKRLWKKELAKYSIDPEEFSEEEVQDGLAMMKRDAHGKRKARIEHQQKLLEPQRQQVDPVQEIEKMRKVVEGFPEVKSLRDSKKIKFDFDGNEFNYEVGDTESLVESMVDENKFFSTFIKDGKPDVAKWSKLMAFAMNPEKMASELVNFGKSLGRNELVNVDLKNSTLEGKQPSEAKTSGDWQSRLLQKFADEGKTYKH